MMDVLKIILLALIAVFLKAFTLSKLWQWFFVSKFNLPEINIAYAMGLLLIISFICPNSDSVKDDETIYSAVIVLIVSSSFVLMIGWVLKHYI